MDFDFQNGKLVAASLNDFRIVNELGIGCIFKLAYRDAGDTIDHTLQLRLSADQCRAIGEQLLMQATLIEYERPTAPQWKRDGQSAIVAYQFEKRWLAIWLKKERLGRCAGATEEIWAG